MKKLLLIIFVASLFVGCNGYKWQKTEKETQTVYILEVGNFAVKGEVDIHSNGIVEFTDVTGRTLTTHISNCVIVDTPFIPKDPQAQQPVKAPVATPAAKKVPPKVQGKVPEKKPGK